VGGGSRGCLVERVVDRRVDRYLLWWVRVRARFVVGWSTYIDMDRLQLY